MKRWSIRLPQVFRLSAVAAALALGGCVERKITVVSDPPGALVWVNDVEMGRTPVTFPFTWYGDYDVRLRLEKQIGPSENPTIEQYYLHSHRVAAAPPFEWMGVDLFTTLLPIDFKDDKIWAFDVPKVIEPTDQELITRAKEMQALLETPTGFEKKAPPPTATAPATAPAPGSAPKPGLPATRPAAGPPNSK